MTEPVTDRTYKAFFDRLKELPDVDPQTIAALAELCHQDELGSASDLSRLLGEMESRHAKNTRTDR